jgi:hypothetical protein
VLIRWQDSRQPLPGWQLLSDLNAPDLSECVSVGWLLIDEPDRKVLAQSIGDTISDSGQAAEIMVIPARCIVEIEELEETRTISSASLSACPAPVSPQKHSQTAAA